MDRKHLPPQGMSPDDVLARLGAYGEQDLAWRTGRTFAYVYDPGPQVETVAKAAYTRFLTENGLDPTAFPSLLRFENDLISICLGHLQAPEGAAGSFTSGGTESIMLAVKAAREHLRAKRPDAGQPELVLPVTAHAAFHKAAHYLGLKLVFTPVDAQCRAIPEAIAAAITPNTALVVASAPSYAHGVIDPVEAIAKVALEAGVLCHVDACVGGWLLPWMRRLGAPVPAFDFSVPGVTSMSMDLHKYGFTPKGASVVLHRSAELRQRHYFQSARWAGYTIINPTVQSSRSGGPVAAAWAVLHHLGDQGYQDLARALLEATRRLTEGLAALGLKPLVQPDYCMFAFVSGEGLNLFHLADEFKLRGWHVQPQLKFEDIPASIHLSLHPGNLAHLDEFLAVAADAVAATRLLPPNAAPDHLLAMVEGAGADLDVSPEELMGLMAALGVEGDKLPDRMAPIHELLNAMPRVMQEGILGEFMGQLFQASRA